MGAADEIPARAPARSCVVCGSSGLRHRFEVASDLPDQGLIPSTDRYGEALADIVACAGCGHMQLAEFPPEPVLEGAYGDAASDHYVEEEAGQRATAARVLERIESITARGRLLDVGCWVGFLLAEARDRGWTAQGLEPSAFASGYAREQLGLDVRTGFLERIEAGGDYDAVVMGDVIEHLVDPGDALDRVSATMRDGAVLALTLPDSGSVVARVLGSRWWSVIPTHVQYFTRASITRLLTDHGLAVVAIGTAPKSFTVRYYLDRLRGYSVTLSRLLVRAAERLGLADRVWAPDLRDRMLVIAIKRRPRGG